MEWISTKYIEIEERISKLTDKTSNIYMEHLPYQMGEPDNMIKQCIIDYYRHHPDLKPPTRHKVHYIAMRYALQDPEWTNESLVWYFYR